MSEINVLLFSKYGRQGASSRLRSYQHHPHLKRRAISVEVTPLFSDRYIQDLYSGDRNRLKYAIKSYIRRFFHLGKCGRFDAIWIEKELFPWLPSLFESVLGRTSIPYLVDYDDAIFHRYDQHDSHVVRRLLGRKIAHVMANASVVTVGNEYLADYAREAGASHVERIPTAVDVDRYEPVYRTDGPFTVGWIGTPYTARYLSQIAPALLDLSDDELRVLLVGAGDMDIDGVTSEVRKWSEETEVDDVQEFDVGIMPLPDDPFERGKCGYKLLQYMACGKPVVASPVGVNEQIVDGCGYSARTTDEWVDALRTLRDDPERRFELGKRGREKVEEEYSVAACAPKLASILRSIADG